MKLWKVRTWLTDRRTQPILVKDDIERQQAFEMQWQSYVVMRANNICSTWGSLNILFHHDKSLFDLTTWQIYWHQLTSIFCSWLYCWGYSFLLIRKEIELSSLSRKERARDTCKYAAILQSCSLIGPWWLSRPLIGHLCPAWGVFTCLAADTSAAHSSARAARARLVSRAG